MKILLIMPHANAKRRFLSRFQYPSLTLQQIAAITPKEHSVEIVDERYENIDFNKNYDLVGISCLTYNSLRGYEIANKFRKRGIPVVLGGYHPTLLPDEAKQHADSIVIGEAELIWSQVLKDVENGTLKSIYKADKPVEAEKIPSARHDIGNYTRMEAIQTSRGCPTGCDFCAMNKIEGRIFRARPVKDVIEEMKNIKAKTIFFADASLTINPNYTKSLFKEMTKLNKKFHCFGNINVLSKDDEFLRLAQEAGVDRWYVGIESVSQESIDDIGKGTNKVENYGKAIRKIKEHGMNVTGFFVFGLDHDGHDIFEKTLNAMYEWKLDSVSFSILTPYPGTRLFERFEKEGRITSYDWSHYAEGNVNFKPKMMSEEELQNGIRGIAADFYSIKNSLKRSFILNNFNPINASVSLINNLGLRSFYKHEKLSI